MRISHLWISLGGLLLFVTQGICQERPQILSVAATAEHAIRLVWQGQSNAVYRIDCTDQLSDSITWRTICEDYPSHGTNTVWIDNGRFDDEQTIIPHPRNSPIRFYRVLTTGTNSEPNGTVGIMSPSAGATVSGDLVVSIQSSNTSQVISETILYVDGQEIPSEDNGTNFIVNTCEWSNGPHVLFAVTKSQSRCDGWPHDTSQISYGHAVSDYVSINFSNLVSMLSFSEPFFDPALGQTQIVSATFAANVDWVLQIQDDSSNVVRSVTGSGSSIRFSWDGNGDGGASLPDGEYLYFVSAQTNGLAYELPSPPPKEEVPGIPEPPCFPPLPPGLEFEPLPLEAGSLDLDENVATPAISPETASILTFDATTMSSSQSTMGPLRPPTAPIKGKLGTFGVCYIRFTNTFSVQGPATGWPYPLQTHVAIDGYSANSYVPFGTLFGTKATAEQFANTMKQKGWKQEFHKGEGQWTASDVKKASLGGSNLFNKANVGLLCTHGSYGTTTEKDSIKYTYLWLENGQYLRLSDLDLGAPGTNGLRWMTIMACSTLRRDNVDSMQNGSKLPINENLHLLCGASTTFYMNPQIGQLYAKKMTGVGLSRAQSVYDSWMNAGRQAYLRDSTIPNEVRFVVMGWSRCFSDRLKYYSDPDTENGLYYEEVAVFTPGQ